LFPKSTVLVACLLTSCLTGQFWHMTVAVVIVVVQNLQLFNKRALLYLLSSSLVSTATGWRGSVLSRICLCVCRMSHRVIGRFSEL